MRFLLAKGTWTFKISSPGIKKCALLLEKGLPAAVFMATKRNIYDAPGETPKMFCRTAAGDAGPHGACPPTPSSHPAGELPDSVDDLPAAVHDLKAPAFAGVLRRVILHHALRDGPRHAHHFHVETPGNLQQGPESLWVNGVPWH